MFFLNLWTLSELRGVTTQKIVLIIAVLRTSIAISVNLFSYTPVLFQDCNCLPDCPSDERCWMNCHAKVDNIKRVSNFGNGAVYRKRRLNQNAAADITLFSPVWYNDTISTEMIMEHKTKLLEYFRLRNYIFDSSAVGITNRLRAGRPRSRGEIPGRARDLSLLHNIPTGSANPSLVYNAYRGLSPG
jgi:hypothetical protein